MLKENVPIDCAAVCLYFGTVSHKILDPVLCDRNVEFNTVLLQSCCMTTLLFSQLPLCLI